MPYIKQEKRPYLEQEVLNLAELILNEGYGEVKDNLVTYTIFLLMRELYVHEGSDWNTLKNAVGTLECVTDEFKRRFLHPYEDTKMVENGDV